MPLTRSKEHVFRGRDFGPEQPPIGEGAYARVVVAYEVLEGAWRAVKRVQKSDLRRCRSLQSRVRTEIDLLSRLSHPFVVDMVGKYHDGESVLLVLEFLRGGDLRRRLATAKKLDEPAARFYASTVVSALGYLHTEGILYRSVRPENVAIDDQGYAKLLDFEACKVLGGPKKKTRTLCGDPEYVAPEVLLKKGYGFPVDVWALGVLVYEMLVGYPPFCAENPFSVYRLVLEGKLPPHTLKPEANAFITRLLVRDPAARPSAVSLTSLPWFAKVDFDALLRREVPPPFVPSLKRQDLIANFDDFLKEDPNTCSSSPHDGDDLAALEARFDFDPNFDGDLHPPY